MRAAGDNDNLGAAGAIADLNGDGDLDLALTAPDARGRGCIYTFSWLPDARTVASDPSSVACGDGLDGVSRFGIGVALGDFDADGHVDAVAYSDGSERDLLWLAHGEPGGLSEGALTRLTDDGLAFGIARLASTDVDGDGYADLVAENDARGALRLLGSPTGLRPFGRR